MPAVAPASDDDVTALLLRWSGGDREALDRLMPLVHDELRRLASRHLGRERAGHTLQTGALVNEAYLRLVDQREVDWQGRAHFLAIAARMMRRILVDHARRRRYAKRGGGAPRVSLHDLEEPPSPVPPRDLVALDEALRALAETDPEQSRVGELRFFGGLTEEEAARVLGLSTRSVARRFQVARAWFYRYLSESTA